jgi:elongation factor P hydroxylase
MDILIFMTYKPDGIRKLAVAVLAGAMKDIIRGRVEPRKKALNWIFSRWCEKDFFFWCDAANWDPETVRRGARQRADKKLLKKGVGMRGYGCR